MKENTYQNRIKILVVDDNKHLLNIISKIIKTVYYCDYCVSSNEVFEKIKNICYDIIFMDISLKDSLSGFEILGELRKIPDYKDIPIIAMTACAYDNDNKYYMEKGFTSLLNKPFSSTELFDAITGALDSVQK